MKIHLLCAMCALSFYTLTYSQNPVPNPGFETWVTMDPDNWTTSNSPGGLNVNISRITPGHTGQYAAKGEVTVWAGTPGFPYIPLLESNTTNGGFTLSERYSTLSMYYQFHKAGPDDVFTVFVGVMDEAGYVFGGGFVDVEEETDQFTLLEIPITYSATMEPYRAFVTMTINNNTGELPTVGSYFIVDDISMGEPTTTAANHRGDSFARSMVLFPNPANAELTIAFTLRKMSRVKIGIFDQAGRQVAEVYDGDLNTGAYTFPAQIAGLNNGLYFCRLITESGVLTRKINIQKG